MFHNVFKIDVTSSSVFAPIIANDMNPKIAIQIDGPADFRCERFAPFIREPFSSLYRCFSAITGGITPHKISTG